MFGGGGRNRESRRSALVSRFLFSQHAQARCADATTLLRSIYRPTRVFIIAIAIAIAMISDDGIIAGCKDGGSGGWQDRMASAGAVACGRPCGGSGGDGGG